MGEPYIHAGDTESDEEEDDDPNAPRKPPRGLPYALEPIRTAPPKLYYEDLATHIYGDGGAYAGDWRRGMRSGWGVYNGADGCVYVGVRPLAQRAQLQTRGGAAGAGGSLQQP